VLIAYMVWVHYTQQDMSGVFHWFGCAIILGDAILSPFNAFRTALRNLGLGVP
jgi:hypothetical protein